MSKYLDVALLFIGIIICLNNIFFAKKQIQSSADEASRVFGKWNFLSRAQRNWIHSLSGLLTQRIGSVIGMVLLFYLMFRTLVD